MWGLFVLLVAGGAYALRSDDADIPAYVQAAQAFGHARLYLKENIPQEHKDFTDPESRQHVAFGIIAAVISKISKQPDVVQPLAAMYTQVPRAWVKYEEVARDVNQILAEASAKVQPITSLIDTMCRDIDSVEKCNIVVNEKVQRSDQFIKNRAKLHLALGRASALLAPHEAKLNSVTKSFKVVEFLLNVFKTADYKRFVKELNNIYHLLRKNSVKN